MSQITPRLMNPKLHALTRLPTLQDSNSMLKLSRVWSPRPSWPLSSNAWKHCPPAVLNYSDEEYPTIDDGSRKQCITDTVSMDNSTNVDTAGDTLMTINLDELQSAYESKCQVIQKHIAVQCTKMEQMQNQLQKTFEQQLQQLELKMELNTKQMFHDFGQHF